MTIQNKEKINNCWKNALDFYGERDNRTLLEIKNLADYSSHQIEILIDPLVAETSTIQQMALLACNLCARWARKIKVVMPAKVELENSLKRDGFIYLEDRLISEMKLADPFGDFKIIYTNTYQENISLKKPLRLFIGSWYQFSAKLPGFSEEDFFINAADWVVTGQRGRNIQRNNSNKFSSASVAATGLAASIGVADLFKRAIGHRKNDWIPTFAWNLWTHQFTNDLSTKFKIQPIENSLDMGKTLIAGVGAIGSSLIYLLDMLELSGELSILDRDFVETSNLNRSPLFNVKHILSTSSKTEICRQYLEKQNVTLEVINGTWHEHALDITADPYDVWISFTNEDGAWAEIPFQMPPVIVQGTTTSGWGFSAGRHIPRLDDCTLCRLPRPEAVFRGPCAEGEIQKDIEITPVRASLPFLSAASASLVLAEIIKLNSPNVVNLPNDISADLKTGLPTVMNLFKRADKGCRGCRATSAKIWERRGGRSRFQSYSNAR